MKKHLLYGAALFSCMILSAPQAGAKSSMDNIMKCLWMNSDVAALNANARQGVVVNGKFYLQNMNTGKIEVWDESGKINEISSTGSKATATYKAGTNITRDDAGNIIVRTGEFNTDYPDSPGVRILSPDLSTVKDFDIQGIAKGRCDFWGHIAGNVLGDEGGVLYFGTTWSDIIHEVPIANGEQDKANTYTHAGIQWNTSIRPDGGYTTTHLVSSFSALGEGKMAFLSPHYLKTSNAAGFQNSIYELGFDDEFNIINTGKFYITPNHNGCTGFYIFECDGNKYICYSSGSNDVDGFSIARLALKDTPANEDSDKEYRVATKYAEANDDGKTLCVVNGFYGNHLYVEPSGEEHKVFIYQFCPKNYIAKYELDLSSYAGIEDITISDSADDNAPVEYFNLQGIKVVNPENGLFIKRQGSKAEKVMR